MEKIGDGLYLCDWDTLPILIPLRPGDGQTVVRTPLVCAGRAVPVQQLVFRGQEPTPQDLVVVHRSRLTFMVVERKATLFRFDFFLGVLPEECLQFPRTETLVVFRHPDVCSYIYLGS
ncbi:hypothetical protein ACFOUS_21935, partial [Deinococcus metalli]|uniref:hypothetical protein n=1 Tax=Deinococcus metalli TaxID=1141878 RepID=UPI00361B2CC2